jgi:hypothetical protein
MRRINLLALALVALPVIAHADSASAERMRRLSSNDIYERKQVASDIYGSGARDHAVEAAMVETLERLLPTIEKKDPRTDELAWYIKVLASTGDMAYMPLIERAIASPVRHIRGHAEDAKWTLIETAEIGRPLMYAENVQILLESEAAQCKKVKQEICQDRGGGVDDCIEEHRYGVVAAGGDSMLLVSSVGAPGRPLLLQGVMSMFDMSTVVANYYDCRNPTPAPTVGMEELISD